MFWVSVEEKTHATPFANTYEYKNNVSDKTTDIAFFLGHTTYLCTYEMMTSLDKSFGSTRFLM